MMYRYLWVFVLLASVCLDTQWTGEIKMCMADFGVSLSNSPLVRLQSRGDLEEANAQPSQNIVRSPEEEPAPKNSPLSAQQSARKTRARTSFVTRKHRVLQQSKLMKRKLWATTVAAVAMFIILIVLWRRCALYLQSERLRTKVGTLRRRLAESNSEWKAVCEAAVVVIHEEIVGGSLLGPHGGEQILLQENSVGSDATDGKLLSTGEADSATPTPTGHASTEIRLSERSHKGQVLFKLAISIGAALFLLLFLYHFIATTGSPPTPSPIDLILHGPTSNGRFLWCQKICFASRNKRDGLRWNCCLSCWMVPKCTPSGFGNGWYEFGKRPLKQRRRRMLRCPTASPACIHSRALTLRISIASVLGRTDISTVVVQRMILSGAAS